MMRTTLDITMSLDGFIAGPNASLEHPLGEGGELLHEWLYGLKSFRALHGDAGGQDNADSELLEEAFGTTGAHVMGRRMFSGGAGPWEDDPNAGGWWGDDPPFHAPVFVVTHHAREPLVKQGGTTFTFVTGGVAAALEQAGEAAGDKNVAVAGGADVVQQLLEAGLLDEMQIHVAPLLLGSGVRLFAEFAGKPIRLDTTRVRGGPTAPHLRFRPRAVGDTGSA